MIYVGIDPGMEGAVAAITERGRVISVADTPTGLVGTKRDYLLSDMERLLRGCLLCKPYTDEPDAIAAAIERVHSMPKQGVASSFTFGKGFGIWLGLLTGLKIPFDLVEPTRWKKTLLDGMGKDKAASCVRAQQLFPDERLTGPKGRILHGRGDALLIAEWRRRQG